MGKGEEHSFNTRLAGERDIEPILNIVKQNLRQNVSVGKRHSAGFITYNPPGIGLKKLIDSNNVIVGTSESGEVVGYLITMKESYAKGDSFFKDFYNNYRSLVFNGVPLGTQNPLIFAQDAVDDKYKGMGVATKILEYARNRAIKQGYSVVIGEIDSENQVSLNAHRKKAGLKEVGEYKLNGRTWKVVATRLGSMEKVEKN